MSVPALRHIAFIMDGNRRWAQRYTTDGLYDNQAIKAIFEAVAACKSHGVSYISLYAFSLENLTQRDETLKAHFFKALIRGCTEEKSLFLEHGVKVRFVGARSHFSFSVSQAIDELEAATAGETGITMQVLFCYGAQQEIADAASRIAHDVAVGTLSADAITPGVFSAYLWTAPAPFPDLIIRTGGAHRLSNFLLYQAAYSELMFLDCLWPEITREKVGCCIEKFSTIKRNFGA